MPCTPFFIGSGVVIYFPEVVVIRVTHLESASYYYVALRNRNTSQFQIYLRQFGSPVEQRGNIFHIPLPIIGDYGGGKL